MMEDRDKTPIKMVCENCGSANIYIKKDEYECMSCGCKGIVTKGDFDENKEVSSI